MIVERQCVECERGFQGETRKCIACQKVERQCATCGTPISSRYLRCRICRTPPAACQFPGCDQPKFRVRGARYCQRHRDETYQRKLERLRKATCYMADCDEPKLPGKFRYCAKHSAEAAKSSLVYRQRASVMQVRRMRERRLGMTHAEFSALLEAQENCCAICGNGNDGTRQLSVDHDHATGAIRGLLCDRCNPMLGYARDSIPVLQAAIAYLEHHSGMA